MMDTSTNVKFTVAVNVDGESKDLSSVVASIVSVMLKPYVDLLAKLVEAGRLSQDERDGLSQQILERQKRFGELLREDLARGGQDTVDRVPPSS
jgi:hypothetical protein